MSPRALLSVADKRGLVALARALDSAGYTLLSTGGTAITLRDAGLTVLEVSEVTQHSEMMDGRVKTLHPAVHAGLLARPQDDAALQTLGYQLIDVLVVNLYRFAEQIAAAPDDRDGAIEQIDIGGPAMLRAAAKNHQRVTVLSDPEQYPTAIARLGNDEFDDLPWRQALAAEVFAQTATYDAMIADYLGRAAEPSTALGVNVELSARRHTELRYGENPHQQAAFYTLDGKSTYTLHQGQALSYNNLNDASAARDAVAGLDHTACVIVKHATPCGAAVGESAVHAYERAFAADASSAFGGIIAFNNEIGAEAIQAIVDRQFAEVVIAPRFASGAIEAAKAKPKLRLVELAMQQTTGIEWRSALGGLMAQQTDTAPIAVDDWRCVTDNQPNSQQMADLRFAWALVRAVKSNAIVYAKDGMSYGIGSGQTSRVMSARVAGLKAADADLPLAGAVMASDAFLPFRDGADAAAAAGITAIVQPGGSIRDDEVIAACNEHGVAMLFTGRRHFKH